MVTNWCDTGHVLFHVLPYKDIVAINVASTNKGSLKMWVATFINVHEKDLNTSEA